MFAMSRVEPTFSPSCRTGEDPTVTPDRNSGRSRSGGLEACWVSDRGWTRRNNEDAFLAQPEDGLLIVADGMGGEHAGEVAASRVVEWLPGLLKERIGSDDLSEDEMHARMREAVVVLNHRVRSEASDLEGVTRMGATVTAALLLGSKAHVVHMGDSRAYLFRDGALTRLTRDHSVVGMLLERDALTPRQAATHPMRGRLARYVGMGGNAKPDVTSVVLRDGDVFLLCTDGLTDVLTDERIQGIVRRHADVASACWDLMENADGAGRRDNVTVVVARWRKP
jgi:serine/threonine protein phosphatase PrpC